MRYDYLAISGLRRILQWFTLKKALILLFGCGAGLLFIALFTYQVILSTESSGFCGNVCHEPMYPEYTTYQASPHSTVACSSCHVGAGTYNLVTSKLKGLTQITAAIMGTYQRPIPSPVENLRPARETCGKCHEPQKFSGDIVRTVSGYKSDETNTRQMYTVVLKVGGGANNTSQGIHWHTTSQVWYLPMDTERLDIGWVGFEKDGVFQEYINPADAARISPEIIEAGKRQMDCVDCHNRASHIFRSPDELIDKAMSDSSIDDTLPFVKREAMKAIGTPSPSLKEADTRAESLADFYKENYPALYIEKKDNIDRAVAELKNIARLTTFPDMLVDWNTHADHSGHNKPPGNLMANLNINFDNWETNKSPGCFRCHGTLFPIESVKVNNTAGQVNVTIVSDQSVKPLDASCNLCHYTIASQAASPIPKPVPHPTKGLEECVLCHGSSAIKPFPKDHPWSTDDICLTCHKTGEESRPALQISPGSTKTIPHPTQGLEDCLLCHDRTAPKPFGSDHPWSSNETCVACHVISTTPLPTPTPTPIAATTPLLSHPVAGLESCLICHGKSGVKPFKANHPWSTVETCVACHKSATTPLPVAIPAPIGAIPSVPHSVVGPENCLLCHGKSGARPTSNQHPWATNEVCFACHQSSGTVTTIPISVTPPVIPHSTDGLADCRQCHGPTGVLPYPTDHSAIPTDFCTMCHKPE